MRTRTRTGPRAADAGRLRVCHIIPDTLIGGAELMLFKLATRLIASRYQQQVISLLPPGPVAARLREAGIPVHSPRLSRTLVPDPPAMLRLMRMIRRQRPDVVQTWMYHADLIGGLAARLCMRVPIVWNVRHATLDRGTDSRNMRLSARLCGKVSGWVPDRIVLNSEAARDVHLRAGYRAESMLVIPNGFDLERFRPDPQARARFRQELGLTPDSRLVGLLGRFHPHKDFESFVKAAADIAARHADAVFLAAGDGVDWNCAELSRWIDVHGLRPRFRLLGPRADVAAIYASLDAYVCCSRTEAFPNVVGEAMACGVPCVVTNVGDCARLVGSTEALVEVGDVSAIAAAVHRLLNLSPAEHAALGVRARSRIAEHFEIGDIVSRYEDVWRGVVRLPHAPRLPAAGRRAA